MNPESQSCRSLLSELKCCIVAPTYNNAATLAQVLADVALYVPHIIVVNDGSTDGTRAVLTELENQPIAVDTATLEIIHLPVNSGKGTALRKGFAGAVASGFCYVITIDTDGQHFADDIPVFAAKLKTLPGSMIVGARNMEQDGIPGRSSFGNKFSNFWYRLETGIRLPDTQSGYRLYPVDRMKGMRFFTSKYEFEIESLVRVAWAGIPVSPVPVKVYYAPGESRVSHFRPFRDFTRISLLNTVLVLVAFLWIKPRDLLRRLSWQNLKRVFYSEFIDQSKHPLHVACSAGFGVFMGIVPIWGYQLIVGLSLAHFMKLNKTVVFIAANISIPPMIPVILYVSFLMGGWLLGNPNGIASIANISLEFVKQNFFQYVLGSVVFALASGIVVLLLTWVMVLILRKSVNRS